MGKHFSPGQDDARDDEPSGKELTPVKELPYYDSLRTLLEPYRAASDEATADTTFTSAEIIHGLEEHHGVLQGINGKFGAEVWVQPEDFVRAMQHLGFRAVNIGKLQLGWPMKNRG